MCRKVDTERHRVDRTVGPSGDRSLTKPLQQSGRPRGRRIRARLEPRRMPSGHLKAPAKSLPQAEIASAPPPRSLNDPQIADAKACGGKRAWRVPSPYRSCDGEGQGEGRQQILIGTRRANSTRCRPSRLDAAPHPNPLPVKDGEREKPRRVALPEAGKHRVGT